MVFTKGAHHSAKFQTFDCSSEISPNLYFDRLLCWKCIKFQLKRVWRSYISWYHRVVKNLKKSLFFVSKMTRICQIFIRTLKSAKIGIFMGFFCPKQKMYELQTYRGVISNDTEEWWKIWRGIDLSFQNWHKEFDEFWLENSKVSKIYTLMGCFWPKYIMFELKKYRGAIFHDTKVWCKIWRKTDLWFGKWHDEFGKFSPEHMEFSNFGLSLNPFMRSRKCMSLKLTGELWNLTNFDPSTQKSQKLAF